MRPPARSVCSHCSPCATCRSRARSRNSPIGCSSANVAARAMRWSCRADRCRQGTGWRSGAAQRPSRLRGRALRVGVAVVLTLAVLIGFRTLNGLDAGASLLVAMAALKLMETQRVRDWLIVVGASLFLLLAACLAAQALWLIPFYAAELWLLCTALYALGAGPNVPAPALLLRTAARSLLLALPLAILLYLFFPRLQ